MFGHTELDDDAIKYYAESDFFLPQTLPDLEEQICTCIQALELFTSRKGIAVEGYLYGMSLIARGRRIFKHFLAEDPLFAVKFAYLLDRVFQNFVDELGDYYAETRPIDKARKALKGSQKAAIDSAMMGYEVGAAPRLFLPSSLRANTTESKHQPGKKADNKADKLDDGKKEAKKGQSKPEWWTKNPSPVKDWLLPQGKRFHDFFNSMENKANMNDWPKLPHHKPGNTKPKGLCLKYQVVGECSHACFMSHANPATFDAATRKIIDDRFKLTCT
jgi:hypothetical protein